MSDRMLRRHDGRNDGVHRCPILVEISVGT